MNPEGMSLEPESQSIESNIASSSIFESWCSENRVCGSLRRSVSSIGSMKEGKIRGFRREKDCLWKIRSERESVSGGMFQI